MRVIAGELRGRRLVAPPGGTTRPTSDRVREATFMALTSLGVVDDATVIDLFAGSGALGIEALSRGARHATFVERDRVALQALRTNLEVLGLDDRARVHVGDATRPDGRYDLALIDPPYDFDGWEALLSALDADVAVCESAGAVDAPPGWTPVRQKRYGGTVVSIFSRTEDLSEDLS